MDIPEEYYGREQSYLKHRVLREYLMPWAMKLGFVADRIWYVDCFAGPWRHASEALEDTSIHIGLTVLRQAVEKLRESGRNTVAHALFVEKDPRAFCALESYLRSVDIPGIETEAFPGEFGEHAATISRRLGKEPAFIFVDPTGFKGAGIRHIATVADGRQRDVLVNVMVNDLQRFKDDPREFLREIFCEFFGEEPPAGKTEAEAMDFYRDCLKDKARLTYAADLSMPHPTDDRTWFRLVVGGHHPKVLEVFRNAEAKVMAKEAAQVRTSARDRRVAQRTGQLALLDTSPDCDPWYGAQNERDLEAASAKLMEAIAPHRQVEYMKIWPGILENHHITKSQLSKKVLELEKEGKLRLHPAKRRQKVVEDEASLIRTVDAAPSA